MIQLTSGDASATCTGTVVAPNLVLTAGHCVYDMSTGATWPSSDFKVFTGSVNPLADGTLSLVSKVILDPGFTPVSVASGLWDDYDAALLTLTDPTSAEPIELASGSDSDLYAAGTEAQFAGWGETSGSSTSLPAVLQTAPTVVQSQGWCANEETTVFAAPFDSADQICTLDTPSDATSVCWGDSGGPLVVTNSSGTPVEIGITYGGDAGCDPTYANYFTSVSAISPWVNGELSELAPAELAGTIAATDVTDTSATVRGDLDSYDRDTTVYFEYGTSTEYGSVSASRTVPADSGTVVESAELTGLTPQTTYHYRLVADNGNGKDYGPDEAFTTAAPSPEPGTYRGTTSQSDKITVGVSASRRAITELSFSVTLRCTRSPRTLRETVTRVAPRLLPQRLKQNHGLGFDERIDAIAHSKDQVDATFTWTGRVSGTLDITLSRGLDGTCSSGVVHWRARV